MTRGLPLLLLLIALAGCAGGGDEPEPRTLPVEQLRLRIGLAPGAVDWTTLLDPWARAHGVGLEIVAPGADGLSLVELDDAGRADWAEEGRLAELPPEARTLVQNSYGRGEPAEEAFLLALPWRVAPVAIVVPGASLGEDPPTRWEELAGLAGRLGPLGLVEGDGGLLEAYLPLLWAAGGALHDPAEGIRLDGAAAEEALAFLQRLTRGEGPRPFATLLEEFQDGDRLWLLADPARLQQLRQAGRELALLDFPAVDDSVGVPSMLLHMRWLALPRGAPHADLAFELARHLCSVEMARRLPRDRDLPALREGWTDSDPLVAQMQALLSRGRAMPLLSQTARVRELLARAVLSALERRRAPDAALAEAQRDLLTQPLHR